MGGLLKRLRDWLAGLAQGAEHSPNTWVRLLGRMVALSRYAISELRRNRATQMAAALTYHTLFSILPTLALALVVLQAFLGPEQQDKVKNTIIAWAIGPLQAEEQGAPEGPDAEPTAAEGTADGTGWLDTARSALDRAQEFHQAQEALETRVEQILDGLQAIDFRSIGLVGLLLFIYAATGLLTTIERSFATVFGVSKGRPLHRRLPLYYTIITIGPIIVLAGLFVRGQIIDALEAGAWTSWLARVLSLVSPLLTSWLVIFVMFLWIPNTRVKATAAMIGALVTTLGLGLLVRLFGIYVSQAATTTLYGALAVMPLFLFYLYLSWMIMIFGLELAYAIQTLHDYQRQRARQVGAVTADPAWAVPVAVEVARAFARGELADAQSIADRTELPLHEVERLLNGLECAHIALEAERDKRTGFILARPADRVPLGDVLRVAHEMGPKVPEGDGHDPAFRAMLDVREAELSAAGERTLADLVAETDDKGGAQPA